MATIPNLETESTLTFSAALIQAEAQARSTLAVELHERLSAGVALVKDGRVFQTSTGDWQVDSSSTEGLTYTVNGTCQCSDHYYNKPPQGLCKHRLAMFLAQRVASLMAQPGAPVVPAVLPLSETPAAQEPPVPEPPVEPVQGIDPRHIVFIQGRPFVRFCGLLDLAHKRGLQELRVDWTFNDSALSLAHAIAVFPFGRFEESGDASPENVTRKVAPHFRRCALTRASARALRLALGLDIVAVEELAEE